MNPFVQTTCVHAEVAVKEDEVAETDAELALRPVITDMYPLARFRGMF